MFYTDDPLILVSLILQLVVIVFLLQGAFRKFPLVLAYSLARLATSVVEVLVFHQGGKKTAVFRRLYYFDRVALNLILFLMVTAIIFRLLQGNPERSTMGKALTGVVGAVLLLPFLVLSRPFTSHWLDGMSQFLYFGSGVMTLALWTVLIRSRSHDSQLLKFTAGLGVAMTGAAVSFGLRQWMHSPHLLWMPNLLLQLTHVAGVLAWCLAFRPARPHPSAPPVAIPSH